MKKKELRNLWEQVFDPYIDYPTIQETCSKCGHGKLDICEELVRVPSGHDEFCQKCAFYKRLREEGWRFG